MCNVAHYSKARVFMWYRGECGKNNVKKEINVVLISTRLPLQHKS